MKGRVKILPCEFTSTDKSLCEIVLKIAAEVRDSLTPCQLYLCTRARSELEHAAMKMLHYKARHIPSSPWKSLM